MIKKIIFIISLLSCAAAFACDKRTSCPDDVSEIFQNEKDTINLIDSYLTKLTVDKNFSGGLLIVKDGKQLLCKGYGWADKEKKELFTPATLASIGSITKLFTATAIMKLVEQNKLAVNDPLIKFFPNIPVDKADITIHQLLTHSSGFHEFLTLDGGDYEKINAADFLKRAFSEPLAFRPGEKAVYTNVGMSILGIIIEQVSGLDYEQFLKQNLFEPIGIKNIGYHYPMLKDDKIAIGYQNSKKWGTHQLHFEQAGGGPYWNLKANGGLEVSLNEMLIWLNGFTNHTLLKKSSIDEMFKAQMPEDGYNGESSFGYGCNISKSRRNTKMIVNGGSNGIYYARIVRLPEEGLVFYMVTNESSINTSMVLPNVTQLYFQGNISEDALAMQPKFENKLSKQIYDILEAASTKDFETELAKAKLNVEDDMVLLNVGQMLMQEKKNEKALMLYKYYTKKFPNIVVAWNDLGDVYQGIGNKEEAVKCFSQALKIRPENQRAKESLQKLK